MENDSLLDLALVCRATLCSPVSILSNARLKHRNATSEQTLTSPAFVTCDAISTLQQLVELVQCQSKCAARQLWSSKSSALQRVSWECATQYPTSIEVQMHDDVLHHDGRLLFAGEWRAFGTIANLLRLALLVLRRRSTRTAPRSQPSLWLCEANRLFGFVDASTGLTDQLLGMLDGDGLWSTHQSRPSQSVTTPP
ncbi:hypothetical protein P171DRAFT_46310 [Karstenula rhodostoma CBS 690.94]|uniref:Uncharacterized protein n=1 Tax=Karstenula rhodostoma CBS 690.94 TaxID=1392251 RepID=A0A9P4PJA3_9PLEO|nr:hypothetical protein P171DRAFT_46310 [Karstenula rhodostoma CBS 690.94]